MVIKVYTDILFLTNLFMDYILLYISMKIIKKKTHILRMVFAAFIGGLYGVVSFFSLFPYAHSIIAKVFVAALMTFIAFRPNSLKEFLKYGITFAAVSFCAGGIAFSVMYYTSLSSMIGAVFSGGIFYANLPIYKIIFTFILCYAVVTVFFHISKKRRKNSENLYDVSVYTGKKHINFTALSDSGNLLTEPQSGIPVMVVKKEIGKTLLKNIHTDFKKIPYKSLSGSGEMYGFIPEKITINKKSLALYIAISDINFGDGFDAILPHNFEERIEYD